MLSLCFLTPLLPFGCDGFGELQLHRTAPGRIMMYNGLIFVSCARIALYFVSVASYFVL